LTEDSNTQVSSPEKRETQLKHDKSVGFSFAPKDQKTELLFNLYKENVCLESSKFLDAERQWRAVHSECLTTELTYEEDSAGMGTVGALKSAESARGETVSSEELLNQQQIEIGDAKMETSDIVKPQESADIISSSQDASQELKMNSVVVLPEDSRYDIRSSQVMSQDQELRAVSSELITESEDYISPPQDVCQESKLKSSSEITVDEIPFILHQGHSVDQSNCCNDMLGIQDVGREHQEQLESEPENDFQDCTKIRQKEAGIQGVPEDYDIESVYCYYDVVALRDAERQHQENITLLEPAETDTNTSTNVTCMVENNLENLSAEVHNSKNEEVTFQTESAGATVRTWATVAAHKKPDSLQDACSEETSLQSAGLSKSSVSESSDLRELSQPSVRVCVAEVEKQGSNVPEVEVDPEGFIKFVTKKEMRKRRSRSRSRSCPRDDVATEKPQQAASVTDVQTKENGGQTKEDSSVKGHGMNLVTFESSGENSVPHAVDTKSDVIGSDVEVYATKEDQSSFKMIQPKSGKEGQKAGKKPERAEGGKEKKKKKQRSVTSAAHAVPFDSGRMKPLSAFVQGVEGTGQYSKGNDLQQCLSLDGAFWPDKWQCDDAECLWQETVAQCQKPGATSPSTQTASDERPDRGDDPDGGSSGHSSPGPHTPKGRGGSGGLGSSDFTTEQLSADLPGGICSWPGENTYLSVPDTIVICPNEQKTTEDETGLEAEEEHASHLAHKVAEEVFTDLNDEQEPERLFYSPPSTAQEAQPICRKDDITDILMVQMKV
jgi:hypothetical protein